MSLVATTIPSLSSSPFNSLLHQRASLLTLRYHPPISFFLFPQVHSFLNLKWAMNYSSRALVGCPQSSLSRNSQGVGSGNYDGELRIVLELATDSELYELERILFGPSYFSPLLKSITKRADIDYIMIEEDPEEREEYITMLESRFFYLAADARSTLRGWRPSYRNVLLDVRKLLNIHCSTKLPTEDLEVEIFLHLLQEYSRMPLLAQDSKNKHFLFPSLTSLVAFSRLGISKSARKNLREESGIFSNTNESPKTSDGDSTLENGLNQWKLQVAAALRGGAGELQSMILKGGGVLTVGRIYELLASRLSGKMFQEAAKYQIKNELIKKGGQLAALNLESRAALLAARKGLAGAASCYLGLKSMMTLLGPMLWGTLLADIVIQMLGTDYARILRSIYAFAQIRIMRTYGLSNLQ